MRVFDANGDIKADTLSTAITTSTTAAGDLAGTYPSPTVSGLVVKVASTIADALVKRNATDDGWVVTLTPVVSALTVDTGGRLLTDLVDADPAAGATGQVDIAGWVFDKDAGELTPASKPTVAGSRAANPALASLLSGLASIGLLVDNSSI